MQDSKELTWKIVVLHTRVRKEWRHLWRKTHLHFTFYFTYCESAKPAY